eukprot:14378160-Alexandrium_andersonii.AAC.1
MLQQVTASCSPDNSDALVRDGRSRRARRANDLRSRDGKGRLGELQEAGRPQGDLPGLANANGKPNYRNPCHRANIP